MVRYHAPAALQESGTIMVREATAPNTPSVELFPYDLEYRRRIDNDMTDAAVEYIADHAAKSEPFFVFMGLTRPHFPNLPSDEWEGKSRIGGYQGYMNETTGLPMGFKIEADPREMRNVMTENSWVMRPYLATVGQYRASLKKHPNPPPANITVF